MSLLKGENIVVSISAGLAYKEWIAFDSTTRKKFKQIEGRFISWAGTSQMDVAIVTKNLIRFCALIGAATEDASHINGGADLINNLPLIPVTLCITEGYLC